MCRHNHTSACVYVAYACTGALEFLWREREREKTYANKFVPMMTSTMEQHSCAFGALQSESVINAIP